MLRTTVNDEHGNAEAKRMLSVSNYIIYRNNAENYKMRNVIR